MLFANAPHDTLAFNLKGGALCASLDRSKAKVQSAASAITQCGWFGTMHDPMRSAVEFYLGNHAVSTLLAKRDLLEPLPDAELALVRHYRETASTIATRLFFYVLLITARESRHCKHGWDVSSEKVLPLMTQSFPDYPEAKMATLASRIFATLKKFPDNSSEALDRLHEVPQDIELGHFTRQMAIDFHKLGWPSSYGGKKWGVIADALYSFVSGEWTAEMFADTAFTLAHNCAPIFNKGMLYKTPDTSELTELLDVQRAGQVPQWVLTKKKYLSLPMVDIVTATMPELMTGEVDWDKVSQFGVGGNYAHKVPIKPPTPPAGCLATQTQIDHLNSVYHLDYKRAA